MPRYTVDANNAGMRLDKFLDAQTGDMSRSQIQKQIKAGNVALNGEAAPPHHALKQGDTVVFEPSRLKPQKKKRFPKEPNFTLEIINDAPDFLVVNKPAGLLTHEAPGESGKTLIDLVLEQYPNVRKIGEDPMRPGIMHRLDKEVSGLLVVAKTQDMFDDLKNQFKSRQVKKEYVALVYGAPDKDDGEIDFNIDRSETAGYKMAAVPTTGSNGRGKRAVTEFRVARRYLNYTLLNIYPQTGRTHQIRVHLNAYGLPIVGDLVYHPKKLKMKIKMNRIFLHAVRLGFQDLNREWRQYETPLPDELTRVLQGLKHLPAEG